MLYDFFDLKYLTSYTIYFLFLRHFQVIRRIYNESHKGLCFLTILRLAEKISTESLVSLLRLLIQNEIVLFRYLKCRTIQLFSENAFPFTKTNWINQVHPSISRKKRAPSIQNYWNQITLCKHLFKLIRWLRKFWSLSMKFRQNIFCLTPENLVSLKRIRLIQRWNCN